MGNWFGKGKRGFLFGMWAGNANAGDLIGTLIASIMIDYLDLGWTYAFYAYYYYLYILELL